jgi:D-lactate dehydrogenase (cytochrome)
MRMPSHVLRARDPRGDADDTAVERAPDVIAAHLEDAAHFPGGRADGVARPRTEADVAALLQASTRVLPIGAQSSVTGGATPAGGVVLSTARMTSLRDAGPAHVRAGAGVALDALQAQLSPRRLRYPPVPTFTGAFVGGVVATNAAGAATFKYGTTRAWVDGLTVVLPCGHVLDLVRGEARAAGRRVDIACDHGVREVATGTYRLPDVPKCSAGYFAAPDMDPIDLFIGSEGTIGVIVDATLRVVPAQAVAHALIPLASETDGLMLAAELRRASQATWAARDPRGIDVAAIEHLDRRCLEMLREDGVDRAHSVTIPPDAALLLLAQLELPPETTPAAAFDEIGSALDPSAPDTPLTRFCRTLDRYGVLGSTELALPGDARRAQQLSAVREGAPVGVNRRVGDARRTIDARIDKTAADMIVPFDRFDGMMRLYREGYARRGLDYAIWGHISDGNVHPNVIPRSYADVVAGREAILELGRDVVRMGGSPLAEHGVGRSTLKQALLRQMYGDRAIDEMRAIKRAIDPEWKLADGVLFPKR